MRTRARVSMSGQDACRRLPSTVPPTATCVIVGVTLVVLASPLQAQTSIPLSQATTATLPATSGDGVFIEAYNGIGGGTAPTPAAIAAVTPTGTTLSPFVDFPRPGATINVGQSFTNFFASTTRPPDQLTAVAARNFILRMTTLLRIENSLDRNTGVPGIDVRLGVGSDDGFHLTVGTTFLGQTGDRGFGYSYFDLRFEGEGLYPVTLLFAANSVGFSGLEFSWITARSGGALEIIPQQFLYLGVGSCDRQVVFEEFPAGTLLTDQYRNHGLIFNVTGGSLQITSAQPSKFVPVSPDRVFADPVFPPAAPGRVEFTFVVPGTATPAATNYFSFYVIDAETTGAGVTAYDTSGAVVFDQTYHGGGASREQVIIQEPSVARVVVTLGDSVDTSAIDSICFATPVQIAPPVIADVADAVGGQGIAYTGPSPTLVSGTQPVVWSLVSGPEGMTIDPASGVVTWASPVLAGTPHAITIRASNTVGSDEETWNLKVVSPPQIVAVPDATIRAAGAYQVALQVNPEAGQVAWMVVAGPADLGVDPVTGLVTWLNPANEGSPHTVTVRATNIAGSDEATWVVTVLAPPVIADIPDTTIPEGAAYSVTPELTRSTPPVTWSLLTGPAGMTMNPNTGTVNWPAPAGAADPWFVVIQASDLQGTDTESWYLSVPVSYRATVSASLEQAPAGTPVLLQGTATRVDSGQPAPGVPVTIRVRVQGTRRVISALTDAEGAFQALFQPLPTEAGRYLVGADHPAITTDKTDDAFTLYGMQATPGEVTERLTPGDLPQTKEVTLRNLGDTPLTGLSATVEGAPANLSVQVRLPTGLAVLGAAPLGYTIVAQDASVQTGSFTIRVTSAEGAVALLKVNAHVSPLVPHLAATPASLSAGMLRGEQTLVEFEVTNDGGATSQAVQVQIPSVPWLSLGTPAVMPAMPPGGKASIVLILSPADDLPLGPYQGSLQVSTNLSSVSIPFAFECISDRRGNLRVTAVDEYTYWAEGAPKITGADVVLRHPQTGAIVATGGTDGEGTLLLENLTEAYYGLEVSAEDHGTFRTQVLVSAGQIKDVLAFLPRQVVTYNWTVVPVQFEDEYRIVVEAVFETHVPAPVITIDPPFVDLTTIGCDVQIDFTITNHGLITAQAAAIQFANNDSRYEFTPLVTEIGDIPANGTAVVPVRIHDRLCPSGVPELASTAKQASPLSSDAQGPNLCAVPQLGVRYTLVCGVPIPYFVPVGFRLVPGDCPGGGPVSVPGGPGGGGGGIFVIPPAVPSSPGCCDEGTCDCLQAMAECAIGFTPLGCPYGLFQSCYMNTGQDWIRDVIGCVGDGLLLGCLAGEVPILGTALSAAQCACNLNDKCDLSSCKPPCDLASVYDRMTKGGGLCGPSSPSAPLLVSAMGSLESGTTVSALPPPQQLSASGDRLLAVLAPAAYFLGDPAWLGVAGVDVPVLRAWLQQFTQMTQDASESGVRIAETERQTLLALALPAPLTMQDAERFLSRYNRTLDYNAAGIFEESQVPAGSSLDFIVRSRMLELYQAAREAAQAAQAEGFDGPLQALSRAKDNYQAYKAANQEQGVCARVRIQIDQRAVISRSAFRATLELENGGDVPLESVAVTLDIRDAERNQAGDRFGIYPPVLTNLSDVDGGGSVGPGVTGKAEWTLLPGDTAAPTEPARYTVGGTLHYTVGGVPVTIPLFPADITVLPNPSLYLKYFLERDVYSDDPFTPEVEPAVPFSLGLIAHNAGAGVAGNFRITSSQPKIIENEKGLLIDFVIIGTRVGGQSYSPSLTANLGDLGPQQTAVAQWLMTSSLQGKFIEYKATFEHVNGLGDEQFSILDGVEIHEMFHVVRVDDPADDGLPDFLANDVPDPDGLPDTIHSSDNSVLTVTPVLNGAVDGSVSMDRLEVQLTASIPAGWVYLRVENPAGKDFKLARVLRPDGTEVRLGDNAWTTHRIVRLEGQAPREENLLHLVDHDGPGTYRLVFAPLQPPSAADLDGNGTVDGVDWGLFLSARGRSEGQPGYLAAADFDHDGVVTFADQQLWMAAYRQLIGNPTASPPAPIYLPAFVGDVDADADVDADDFGVIQRCFSGSGLSHRTPGCELARLDGDLDVDLADVARFKACSRGAMVPPPEACRR